MFINVKQKEILLINSSSNFSNSPSKLQLLLKDYNWYQFAFNHEMLINISGWLINGRFDIAVSFAYAFDLPVYVIWGVIIQCNPPQGVCVCVYRNRGRWWNPPSNDVLLSVFMILVHGMWGMIGNLSKVPDLYFIQVLHTAYYILHFKICHLKYATSKQNMLLVNKNLSLGFTVFVNVISQCFHLSSYQACFHPALSCLPDLLKDEYRL